MERGTRVEIKTILLEERRSCRGQFGCHPRCGAPLGSSIFRLAVASNANALVRGKKAENKKASGNSGRHRRNRASQFLRRRNTENPSRAEDIYARNVHHTKGAHTIGHMRFIGSLLRISGASGSCIISFRRDAAFGGSKAHSSRLWGKWLASC